MTDDSPSIGTGTSNVLSIDTSAGAPCLLVPDWPAPPGVRAFTTLRGGGVSRGVHGLPGGLPGGLNLGSRCGDDVADVTENRRRLRTLLPSDPFWLRQVHGVAVVSPETADWASDEEPEADAAVTTERRRALVVLTADCLPVFIADVEGRAVGVAHAGWRGLAAGVLERTVDALQRRRPHARWLAHIGPGIGPEAFEVGNDVRDVFVGHDAAAVRAFRPTGVTGKWRCDLGTLARDRLRDVGVTAVTGGADCTVGDPRRFFSHRRDRAGGRFASVIWLA